MIYVLTLAVIILLVWVVNLSGRQAVAYQYAKGLRAAYVDVQSQVNGMSRNHQYQVGQIARLIEQNNALSERVEMLSQSR